MIGNHQMNPEDSGPGQISISIPNNKVHPEISVAVQHKIIKIQPNSVPVFVDSNPIARYNYMVDTFNTSCNRIQGVQFTKIWILGFVSKMYDAMIFFYKYLWSLLTCQLEHRSRGCCYILLMLGIYFLLLFGPFICYVTLAITSLFALYFIIGIVVKVVNYKKLGDKQFTHNMIADSFGPKFDPGCLNEYFLVTTDIVETYYRTSNNMALYEKLLAREQKQFMVYRQRMLDKHYHYITSSPMIIIHILALGLSILGSVVSGIIFINVYRPGSV